MDTAQQNVAEGPDSANGKESSRAKTAGRQHKLGIDVLKIIHAARQTYGLRTNDYARYHAHATRRVATLHRATNTLNKPSSKKNALPAGKSKKAAGSKGASGSTANKAAYTSTTSRVSAESVLKDERLLELLLWETERAWSEGMKQREEVASLERSNTSQALAAKRHRSVKRFQRASEHAAKMSTLARTLYNLPNAPFSAAAAFQIEIYSSYMQGTLGFIKATSPGGAVSSTSPSAASALESLGNAYVLLESYAQITPHATEEAIAYELLDELEPLIRFCAYKCGSGNDLPAEMARSAGQDAVSRLAQNNGYPDLLASFVKEQKTDRKNMSRAFEMVNHLSWRDIDLPIRNAELAELLGKVNMAIAHVAAQSFSKGKRIARTSVYDRSLATLIEAEDKARRLVDDNSVALARAHSARFEAAAKPLNLVHSYILFHLLSIRLQRDETLFEATLIRLVRREAKSTAVTATFGPLPMRVKRRRMKLYPVLIKLLDGMTQSCERLRSLAVVEEDSTDLAEEVDALTAYTRARRCLYLGETYAMLDKFAEALSLLQRGTLYMRQAQVHLKSIESQTSPELTTVKSAMDDVSLLQVRLERSESRTSRDWFEYNLVSGEAVKPQAAGDGALTLAVENISLHKQANGRRAKKPRKIGPVFFDVAFNYIAPVRTDEQAEDLYSDRPGDHGAAFLGDNVEEARTGVDEDARSPSASAQSAGRGIWGFFGMRK